MEEKEKTEIDFTTITLKKTTKLLLDKQKIIPQEPYDDLIKRILKTKR